MLGRGGFRLTKWMSNCQEVVDSIPPEERAKPSLTCLKAGDLDISSCNVELHMFSDASQYAYGAAAYVKIYDRQGNGKCSFVMGKSRLAPIKTLTIPRLELAAAVVSVRLYQMLIKELDTKVDNCYFWTDSMIVLGYVRNTSRRFKTYVANRLALIHELTSPNDWRHVPTNMNPADLASRGEHPEEGGKLFICLNGPKFLNMEKDDWPHKPDGITTEYEDVEMKPAVVTSMVQSQCQDVVSDILNRYSDWYKLQRAVAWLLRLKTFMIHRYLKHETKEIFTGGCLSLREIKTARKLILMKVQESAYGDEFSKLTSNKKIATSSSLVKLCPVLNEGLLRVGGRFQYTKFSEDSKHPIILPSKHHVTELIVRKYHEVNHHMGAHHVLSLTRPSYWIIHGIRTVKHVVSACMDCKRRFRKTQRQQMALLPVERLTPDKPPFTYVGVDYFVPMYVKVGRSQQKRYGCLFTCLATRAVHIEIAHSLGTDSFVCALQRFMSRRGKPEKIFSDNGTNFTFGERELRAEIAEWNQSRIMNELVQKDIEWQFIPPYASHIGGVWERLVQSVKRALKSVVKEQLLNDEALNTLMTETEKIVNDRPITKLESHFAIQKHHVTSMAPPICGATRMSARRNGTTAVQVRVKDEAKTTFGARRETHGNTVAAPLEIHFAIQTHHLTSMAPPISGATRISACRNGTSAVQVRVKDEAKTTFGARRETHGNTVAAPVQRP
ncbi:uncharacterized protein LOC128235151 [Mya arenaria]|uniref:uncharacterized protein LOC128235151 n=1 Tax=Mya arenaria TaxID=6604 RepID=UPI0022E63F62|nr:uncharacterized protein LOC128235151 [Mya arenaria]